MAAESGEVKAGLPQLDMTLYPAQLFWLAISFGALYLLMSFVVLPGVRRTQDNRQQTLSSELASATAANQQAKAMMTQYEKALADARDNAQTTVNSIKAEAAKAAADMQASQAKELSQRLHEAEAKIAAARNAAVADIKSAASDLAASIVEKITARGQAR